MASGDIDILSGESDDAYVISPSGTRLLTNTRVALRIHADSGGILQSIPANIGFGMSKWLSDDEVLFTDGDRSIHRMSLSSENDTRLTAPEGLDEWHIDPQALPGGNAIVYTSGNYVASNMGTEGSEIRLHKLDSDSSQTLIRDGYMARYAHSGHIVFIRAGDLWAVPFDSESMQVVGEEVSVIEGIESYPANGFANYAFSETGRLVYLPGDEYQRIEPGYTWLSRQGANEEIPLPTGYYVDPELSPDNELLAITRNEEDGSSDIWVYDLTRETFGRRTFSGTARNPKWSPDGSRLAYSQTGQGIWLINADGTGQPQQLTSEPDARPSSFITASGELLYLINSGANVTLKTLSYRDDSWIASPVFPADYPYFNAEVSPDGNWIAYVSRESGDFHVYVRPYPDVENGKWLISNVRGVEPLWNRNGSELFYRESNTLMSVEFETENGFIPGTPKALLPDCCIITSNPPSYAVSGDGERFLTFKLNSSADIGRSDEEVRLTVVENWFEELDRLAPPDPQ
jgi:Tol biopolymer transport system component